MRRRLRLLIPRAAAAAPWPGIGGGLLALLLLATATAPGRAGDDPAAAVGRWERPLRLCRLERQPAGTPAQGTAAEGTAPGATAPGGGVLGFGCRRLRLDQQVRGLLSVRFLAADPGPGRPAGQLVFAGVLAPGSRPMDCDQLRCRPHWPIRLQVSAVARSALPPGPAATDLLQAQLAHGTCELTARRLQCTARQPDGEVWRALAQP